MYRAYLVLLQRIKDAGIVPKKHILDNECSNSMKKLIQETCQLELVQPYCHRQNVAEVAIKNFKAHFISILAGGVQDWVRVAGPSLGGWRRIGGSRRRDGIAGAKGVALVGQAPGGAGAGVCTLGAVVVGSRTISGKQFERELKAVSKQTS